MDFTSLVILLLILMDPIGLAPTLQSLLKRFSYEEKKRIMRRELIFALIILLIFVAAGNYIIHILGLDISTLNISGGIVLFLVAIGMVFPGLSFTAPNSENITDPYIVPIATPLMAGPSTIALILVQTAQAKTFSDYGIIVSAISIAWVISFITLFLSNKVLRVLGNRGAIALEKLMGMLLIIISVQMFINGLRDYVS